MASPDAGGRKAAFVGALALFVAVPIAAAALTGFNILRSSEIEDRAAAQGAMLAQIERRIAARSLGPTGAGDMAPLYLKAASGTLAKAEMQQLIGQVIERASARLIEVRGQDEESVEENGRIRLQVTMDANNESLFKVLYEIETGLPLLSAEQIGVRKVPGRTGAPEIDPSLRVTLVVQGYWRDAAKP